MKSYITVLILVLLFSCKNTTENSLSNASIHIIEIDITPQEIEIKDILNSKNLEFLAKDTGVVIGGIDKIIPYNNLYYVLDKKQSSVIVFNKTGNIESVLFRKGFGPGEYKELSDFTIFNNTICILNSDKILMYSLDGEFMKLIGLDFTATQLENIENQYLAFFRHSNATSAPNENFDLIITDENGKVLRRYFPFTKEDDKNNITTKKVFYLSNEKVYYIQRFNDTIYAFNNGQLEPKYFIDFGMDKMKGNPLENKKYLNYPYFIKNFYENKNHIIFSFNYQGSIYNTIYDKWSEKSICYKTLKSDDRFFIRGQEPIMANDTGFCFVLEPYELVFAMNNYKKSDQEGYFEMLNNYPDLEKLMSIDENDLNPVLSFEKFQRFK